MPESASVTTSDGVRLALARFEPPGAPRGVGLLCHAMFAGSTYLDRPRGRGFASALAARGLLVFALDFRGHGRSVPPRARRESWTFDDYVLYDLPAAVQAAARAGGVAPEAVAIVGHSLGGLCAVAAIGANTIPPPSRLVLVATNVWGLARPLTPGRRALLVALAASARLLGYAPVRFAGVGTDDEPYGYVRQMARWGRTGRWTAENGFDYGEAMAGVASPALVVAADGDSYCRADDARAFAERLGSPITYRIVGRLRGDRVESDHFGFFVRPELEETLWRDIADFLLPGSGSSEFIPPPSRP